MNIASYLAYPCDGERESLIAALLEIPDCQVLPAINCDVLAVMTTSSSQEQEENLQKKFGSIPSLKLMALVFAQQDDDVIMTSGNSEGSL